MNEKDKKYKSISEVAKILNLVNKNTGKLSTHTIRFWEKEFRQIKPYLFSGNRRYYDNNSILIIKKIQYLLKNKGMTIKGAKKLLNENNSDLDENNNKIIKADTLKKKIKKISNLIKNLKFNG